MTLKTHHYLIIAVVLVVAMFLYNRHKAMMPTNGGNP